MSNIDMNMIELTDADLEMVSAAGSDGASVGAVIGFAVGCVYGGLVGRCTRMSRHAFAAIAWRLAFSTRLCDAFAEKRVPRCRAF
jgi:hypothetical protein